MLIARIATSVVLVPLLVLFLWLGGIPLLIVAGAASFQAAREASTLLSIDRGSAPAIIGQIGAVALVLAAFWGPSGVLAALSVVLLVLLSTTVVSSSDRPYSDTWLRLLAIGVYAGFPLSLLILLRQSSGSALTVTAPGGGVIHVGVGFAWLLIVLTVTWATDIGAYSVGRLIGRRPFAPKISPSKTWEGTVGGVVLGAITFAAWSGPLGWWVWWGFGAGIVVASAAVIGDLVESKMKRNAGVKDAGSLLPGHGGLLDRIDSLVFSTVVVFLLKTSADAVAGQRLGF